MPAPRAFDVMLVLDDLRRAAPRPLGRWLFAHEAAIKGVLVQVRRTTSTRGDLHAYLRRLVDAKKPALMASLESSYRRLFNAIVAEWGPQLYKEGVNAQGRTVRYHMSSTERTYNTLRAFTTGGERSNHGSASAPVAIDEAKLARLVDGQATEALVELFSKLIGKIGELEDPRAEGLDGVSFRLTGTRTGDGTRHSVRIEQSMIINFSMYGKAFNQFPALIYIDGKKTSEAKYKQMFGGPAEAPKPRGPSRAEARAQRIAAARAASVERRRRDDEARAAQHKRFVEMGFVDYVQEKLDNRYNEIHAGQKRMRKADKLTEARIREIVDEYRQIKMDTWAANWRALGPDAVVNDEQIAQAWALQPRGKAS